MSFKNEIEKVDKNFLVDQEIDKTGLAFYSPEKPPFRLYGVKREGDRFYRIPPSVAESVSEGVLTLAKHTSGGRVRFMTDSENIAIKARLINAGAGSNQSSMGRSGFDFYVDNVYAWSFLPPAEVPYGYESMKNLEEKKDRLITLNMPSYCGVYEFYIGLDEDARVWEAPDYTYEKPIVYYGSSITQGGCASRPGANYQNWISRALDTNYINLGFSGNAKAEIEIANYIAGLDMSVFVYDYDHNAPTVEFLRETHERMFKIIRDKRPDLPILLVSAPIAPSPRKGRDTEMFERRDVVKATYERALAKGDKKVWFISGDEFFLEVGNEFTCDHTHPTDLGFYFMAKKMIPVIGEMLRHREK